MSTFKSSLVGFVCLVSFVHTSLIRLSLVYLVVIDVLRASLDPSTGLNALSD